MNATMGKSTTPRRFALFALRCASCLFLLVGVLAAGHAIYFLGDAKAYQAIELRKFNHLAPLTEPDLLMLGDAFGEIEVPRLRLNAIIVQGVSDDLLRRAVGHVPETAMPGQSGNIALAGHRDALFRPLRDIRVGDTITLKTAAGNWTYRVNSTEVVPPADIEVLQSRGRDELTLITCFPFHYVGHAPNRFIVHAGVIGK